MKVLLTGGCKNGKSTYAQNLVTNISTEENRYYVATMSPSDDEDILRIKRHIYDRKDCNFTTIEKDVDITSILPLLKKENSVLLDSSTALLSNEMFLQNGDYVKDAYIKVAVDILELSKNVENIVVVSDYIYSDAFLYEPMTENFRFGLSYVDKALAKEFDTVIEMCFSTPTFLKGGIDI